MSNHKHRRTVQVPEVVEAPVKATTHLNYRGDRRGQIGRVMGPNRLDELLTVVDETYDEVTDRTRLGLAFGVHAVAS